MRNVLIIMAGLFLLACNNQEDKKTEKKVKYSDLVNERLNGDIQSVEETPYQVDSSGKIGNMDSCCIDLVEYDENGNAVRFTSKDSKGNVKNQSVYTRHETGLWIGSKDTKEGGKRSGSMKVGVDDKGQYTVAEAFDSTGKLDVYYTDTKQNEFGQILRWKQYDKDSVFRMEGQATYDKNLQMGFTMKDSVGKLKSSSDYKYNDKGEQTEVSNTNITKDSTTTVVTKYTYDSHDEMGNWTQRTAFDDKGKATKIVKRIYTYRKNEEKK
ncbi:MAG TPA: hypothetical protein PKG90_03620 [Chitinophagaceae bacterium]|nr:hypothetical protein [Chitinophagaceae bacterium]